MKKKICWLLFFLVPGIGLSSYACFAPGAPTNGSFLGFNLMPGPNNGVVNFAIVTPLPDGRNSIQAITRSDFIRLASGLVRTDVNPKGENLFVKYEVEECGFYRDSVFNKTRLYCNTLDALWKLRYKSGIYGGSDSLGWTKATVPSMGQMSLLQAYGVNSLDDYFFGENAFRLLHDMQSYAWQSRYQGT